MKKGGMAHCTLPINKCSDAVCHKTVDEIWFFIQGTGEIWRKHKEFEEIVEIKPGICISIPVGTFFQFRNTGLEPLCFIITTMPPWPEKRKFSLWIIIGI